MTLAQARRQVWTRGFFGVLIMTLAGIFLILVLVKYLYLTLPSTLFAIPGEHLRRLIDSILRDSAVLARLWQVIPAWQVIPGWNGVYTVWGAMVVGGVGATLFGSARGRHAQIRQMSQEMEREAWKREERGRVERPLEQQLRVIHQLLAPPEPWHKKPRGIVVLGLVVTVVGGVLLYLVKTLLFTNAR
jgi:hypothetical protein